MILFEEKYREEQILKYIEREKEKELYIRIYVLCLCV
jgi:hypothetical protein